LDRRAFITDAAIATLEVLVPLANRLPPTRFFCSAMKESDRKGEARSKPVTLFLCGDVMTGRGIDQVLPHPNDPRIHEPYVTDARDYVMLAEKVNGSIPKPVGFSYIWGAVLGELGRRSPNVSLINLETSVTDSQEWMPKGINYRMHPQNIPCLSAANVDCCVLANNHVLDWGYTGLLQTLETLEKAGIAFAGAGRSRAQASAPAVLDRAEKGRVLVFAFGLATSGIPPSWAASEQRPGVNFLEDLSEQTADSIALQIQNRKRPRDIVVVSIHWGSNWGYEIPGEQRRFAQKLIEQGGVDILHGHSSHHVKGIEVYKEKPILYGCGDFLNDYEGIAGFEAFRGDLALMYFVTLEPRSGALQRLEMVPLQMRRFSLHRTSGEDIEWLRDTLNQEGAAFGTQVTKNHRDTLLLGWTKKKDRGNDEQGTLRFCPGSEP
jgi:poly-gamma-glutamate capsule biosynthesis protein CapA/YwtB (metallophosphatase superfamily)